MLRHLLCAALALALSAGALPADDEKKPGKKGETVTGRIKKVDPSAHMIIVTVGETKEPPDRQFILRKDTKFVFYSGAGKKQKAASRLEAYKNEDFKEGARVTVVTDGPGKV